MLVKICEEPVGLVRDKLDLSMAESCALGSNFNGWSRNMAFGYAFVRICYKNGKELEFV